MSEDAKSYGTSGGADVTEEDIERLAREAEEGFDPRRLRRRGGRPPMGSGPAEVVPVRLDPELRTQLDHRAEADETTASEVIRRALREYFRVA